MGWFNKNKDETVVATTDGSGETKDKSKTTEGEEKGFFKSLIADEENTFTATDYSDTYASGRDYHIYFVSAANSFAFVSFKGFLTQFGDSFSSNWSQTPAYGRMDNIRTFQNTTRTMNVSFAIPAFDEDEARHNIVKVGDLTKMLYPVYSAGPGDSATSISKAPLIRLRFANLIRDGRLPFSGLLGTVSGLQIEHVLDHGFFDLPNMLLPKTINISFTFEILHEHITGWTGDSEWANDSDAEYFPYASKSDLPPEEPPPDDTTTDEDKEANFFQNLNPWHEGGYVHNVLFED
jgi:hypothetical protein